MYQQILENELYRYILLFLFIYLHLCIYIYLSFNCENISMYLNIPLQHPQLQTRSCIHTQRDPCVLDGLLGDLTVEQSNTALHLTESIDTSRFGHEELEKGHMMTEILQYRPHLGCSCWQGKNTVTILYNNVSINSFFDHQNCAFPF